MPENCNPNDCPLTSRVAALEEANKQHGATHRELFSRMNAVERDNAVQDANYKAIDAKLDEISATVKALVDKPGKRWDSFVAAIIAAIAGALAGFLLRRWGM